jgi:serine/threonine protein kinase
MAAVGTVAILGGLAALLALGPVEPPPVRVETGGPVDLVMIGGLAFLALYNGLLFLPTRQISYLLYSGYGLATAAVYGTYFDRSAVVFGLLDSDLRQRLNHLASGAALSLGIAFALAFLQVGRRRPAMAAGAAGVSLGLGAVSTLVLPFFSAPVREMVLAFPALVLPFVGLGLGIDARRSGFRASRAYLAAWTPLLIVVLLAAVEVVAEVELGVAGRALLGANALEMLLLALGLTERIQVAVAQRERAHLVQVRALKDELREQKKLGPYTLGAKIGEGGMGEVYRARHALLRRPTAVKLIRPERAGADALRRFEREVRTTSRLTHPNTVTVYDYGRTEDGTLYYAMELLEGATLRQVVSVSGPQHPGRVAQVLSMVASALAEAHSIGLIHRDIKPSNIILTTRGGVRDVAKVVDFGLVKELRGDGIHPELSQQAVLAGTPLYMAPELAGSPPRVGPAADLYALGAVGFFLLTGRHLFAGGSVFEILLRHAQREPPAPAKARGEELPAELEELVLALLAKDPADRPPDAATVATRLSAMACYATWTKADAGAWWDRYGDAAARASDPGDTTAGPGGAAPTRPLVVRRSNDETSDPRAVPLTRSGMEQGELRQGGPPCHGTPDPASGTASNSDSDSDSDPASDPAPASDSATDCPLLG